MYLYVPLGVTLKSEQKLEEMVQIMEDLQQYVPTNTTTSEYHVCGSDSPITLGTPNCWGMCVSFYVVYVAYRNYRCIGTLEAII